MTEPARSLVESVTPSTIRAAAATIAPHIHRTPLLRCRSLDQLTGFEVHLKAEIWQKTGSFKPRGALNRIANMTPEEESRGVLAASAGNHAQGLAYAAAAKKIPVKVVMPANAPVAKIDATRQMGAEVILHGEIFDDALERALEIQNEAGMTFVHPVIDPHVVSGAGTVGLEICEDLPEFDAIVCPVGGGGLLTGISVITREMNPSAKLFGVCPESAPAVALSYRKGSVVRTETASSIADGMAGKAGIQETLEAMSQLIDDMTTVSEKGILDAMVLLLTRAKLLTEGAGAAPLAALMEKKIPLPAGARIVLVLSGGNLDLNRLADWVRNGVSGSH
jgi:threonine dehydratase